MNKIKYLIILILLTNLIYAQEMTTSPDTKNIKLPPGVDKTYLDKIENGIIEASAPIEVNLICIDFFNSLILGDITKAYNELLKGSPILKNEKKLKLQKDKTEEAIKIYGKILGYESISVNYLSNSYVTVKFITLHNFNPLLWTISFYKSPSLGWLVINLKLTDYIKMEE